MNSTRVLLSIEQSLFGQLLEHDLIRHPEIEVIGQASNAIETLALIAQSRPHLWIHSWDDGADYQALLSHVHEIAPDLAIFQLTPDNSCGYLQVPVKSIDSLLSHACRLVETSESVYTTNR